MIKRDRMMLIVLLCLSLLLAGCSANAAAEAETEEPLVEEEFIPAVSVTGVVIPQRYAVLSLPSGGVVHSLSVEEGDEVEEGQLLLHIEGQENFLAAIATANLELVNAQQALDDIYDNTELSTSQAQLALANARDALDDEEYRWQVQQEGYRADSEIIAREEANLVLAQKEVDRASRAYNRVSGKPDDSTVKAAARANLANARLQRDSIERNLNWYQGHPSALEQAVLDAKLAVAEALVVVAEQEYDLVENGPNPELLEVAEARLGNASAALTAAEKALKDITLEAPYAGVITTLYVRENEWVSPGQPVMLLADLDSFQIETTDLSEIDVTQIAVGDTATVTFDAVPELLLEGTVTRINEKASEGAGVNYSVMIEVSDLPDSIRWGMTAFVDIEIQTDF